MSYNITAPSGTFSIGTGERNASTSLVLIGKNYPNYGELIQQNLVNLMTHFAGTSYPGNPQQGQIFYNSTGLNGTIHNGYLQVYSGTQWRNITTIYSDSSAPTYSVTQGDLWYKSDDNQLKIYTGSAWQVVGPVYTTAQQETQARPLDIIDAGNTKRTVLAMYANGILTAIISKDVEFTPATPPINTTGFSTVKPGFNVNSTIFGGSGTNLYGSLTQNNQPFVTSLGTLTGLTVSSAINADLLGTATAVSRAAQGNITSLGTLTGLTVSGTTNFNGTNNIAGASTSADIVPTGNLIINLGNASSKWFNSVYANTFYGTSTTAKYADLAECYRPSSPLHSYAIVVFGGQAEVEMTDIEYNPRVAGVLSDYPAFLMNDNGESAGLPIALTGKVPVNIQGPVAKGDCIVTSTNPGVGQRMDPKKYVPGCILGKALEAIEDDSIQLIQVVVGVR
jgi:hypothetical protein